MADNVNIKEEGAVPVAADEIGGIKHQRVKIQHGADGAATDASSANPLPVLDADSLAALEALATLLGGTLVVGDGGGSLTVDIGTALPAGTNNIGDVDVLTLPAIPAGNNNIGDVDVASLPALAAGNNNIGDVDVASLPALPTGGNTIGKIEITGEGKVKVVAIEGALPAGSNLIGAVEPRGNKAHDEVDAGNPVKVGARARTALPTAVSQDDRTDNVSDKFGRVLSIQAPLDQVVSGTVNRTNTESGQLLAALAEGAYAVMAISVTNAHASVGTKVEILDGETVKWKGYAYAPGGGFVIAPGHPLFVGSKNTALNAKCATTGSDVDITVAAYKIPA